MKLTTILLLMSGIVSCNASKKLVMENLIAISEEEKNNGRVLIANNDCFTCHSINNSLVGPSFQNISNRYELKVTEINFLSKKIIGGGGGNWGKLPMIPHLRLLPDSADLMVKYILSLKK